MTRSISSLAVTSSSGLSPWLVARTTLRPSLCARDPGTRADRSIDPCTWIHRSPRVTPVPSGLVSIQVWRSMHRSPHFHGRHAHVPRSKSALGSIDPRVSLHGSARVPPTKTAHPCRPSGDRWSDPRVSLHASVRIPPRHALVPRSKCACHSIQVRLSRDRTPPFADRTGSHVPCPTYFSPDRSRRRAIPGETSTRGTVLRGGASSRHDPRNREGSHDSYFRVIFGYPRAARLQANDARGPQRSM